MKKRMRGVFFTTAGFQGNTSEAIETCQESAKAMQANFNAWWEDSIPQLKKELQRQGKQVTPEVLAEAKKQALYTVRVVNVEVDI